MNFTEKLRRASAGKNKAEKSRAAGLSPTTISNYIASGALPRADIALKIARALEVPLEWLVDDALDEIPPVEDKPAIALLSNDELMLEVSRRYRQNMLRLRSAVEGMMKADWVKLAHKFFEVPVGGDLPADVRTAMDAAWYTATFLHFAETEFDPAFYAAGHHVQMPGSALPPESLNWDQIAKDVAEWRETNQAFKLFQTYARWLQEDPPTSDARKKKLDEHRIGMANSIRGMMGLTPTPSKKKS